jgi:hypothetical protein
MAGSPPTFKLEAFPLRVAVWETERMGSNGKPWKSYSVKLTRTYKNDKTGKWEETPSLGDKDLLAASALLLEVWRTIAVKEGKVAGGGTPSAAPTGSMSTPSSPAYKDEDVPF